TRSDSVLRQLTPRPAAALAGFSDLLDELRSASLHESAADLVERILKRTGYAAQIAASEAGVVRTPSPVRCSCRSPVPPRAAAATPRARSATRPAGRPARLRRYRPRLPAGGWHGPATRPSPRAGRERPVRARGSVPAAPPARRAPACTRPAHRVPARPAAARSVPRRRTARPVRAAGAPRRSRRPAPRAGSRQTLPASAPGRPAAGGG